jgi:trk system potassium uptake protein TrkA
MRIVFVGAADITVKTAELLIGRDHEVVIIETDAARIEALSEKLDCSFLQGDGSNPAILREVGPEHSDVLFCLTDNDQANLIASLVGRSLGFKRIITKISDPEFEGICRELGLENTIIPSRTISRYLSDMVRGVDILELSTVIKDDARFFTFIAEEPDERTVSELNLPSNAKAICFYRDGRFRLSEESTKIRKGDEVVILTCSENLPALHERWKPKQASPK